jgi:hypothetical protein
VRPAAVVVLGAWIAGCSPSSGDACDPRSHSWCDGNSVAVCARTEPQCDQPDLPCNSTQTYVADTPCPAGRPVCQDLPSDISGDTTACQVAGLDRSCPITMVQGSWPTAIRDLNGDGTEDLLGATSSSLLTVSLGDGHGGFRALPPQPDLIDLSSSMVLGDFDGDGRLDLGISRFFAPPGPLTSASITNTLEIALGRGDGTFEPAQSIPQAGSNFSVLAAFDVDGDGADDVLGYDETASTITVVLGSRRGAWSVLAPQPVGPNPLPLSAWGDFNGDGLGDLVVSDGVQLEILLGSRTGVLSPAPGAGPDVAPQGSFFGANDPVNTGSVAVGDVDEDGRPDLVDYHGGAVTIWSGRGDGSFASLSDVDFSPYQVGPPLLADSDGDGHLDLIAADTQARVLVARHGLGGGRFGPPRFLEPSEDASMALAPIHQGGAVRGLVIALGSAVAVLAPTCL